MHASEMTCFVCGIPSEQEPICGNNELVLYVHCPRCGQYSIKQRTTALLRSGFSPEQRANMSGFVRENQDIEIKDGDVEFMTSLRTPTIAEKADKIFRQLTRVYPKPGENVPIGALFAHQWRAVAWTEDSKEVEFLVREYLKERQLVDINRSADTFAISPKGWDYLDRARAGESDSQRGFVAMWFDPSVHPAWLQAIEPGIVDAGYEPIRIDRVEHNNRIDDEIVAAIRACRFLVADFTGNRGGVYYEAGLAHGLGRQVVWLCREDALNDIHFDTRQYNFIKWSPNNLPELRTRLKTRIEATLGRGKFVRKT